MSAKAPLVLTDLSASGVLTVKFNQEKKLNAWTMPLMNEFKATLDEASTRSDVRGVVVTGSGKYYSAGVDLSALLKPMAPSKLIVQLRDHNRTRWSSNAGRPVCSPLTVDPRASPSRNRDAV